MKNIIYTAVIALLFGVALIQAQDCRPLSLWLPAGRNFCLRNCSPQPKRCFTPFRSTLMLVCPPTCCLSGKKCVPLKRLG